MMLLSLTREREYCAFVDREKNENVGWPNYLFFLVSRCRADSSRIGSLVFIEHGNGDIDKIMHDAVFSARKPLV